MKRNTDLDFIRAILIILMILIHIVSFGNAYPQLKAGILSFMMPTFLIITGYLVNIEKTGRQMGNYLKCLALPYVIMVTGFSVLSYYMPVRDGITELSLSQIGEKIFVTSIGPYWFIQTMIICGTLYYFCFSGRNWNDLHKNYTKRDTYASLFVFAVTLLLISETPALSASAAAYYFIGVVIRQSKRSGAGCSATSFSPSSCGFICSATKTGMTGEVWLSSSPAGAASAPCCSCNTC